MENLLYHYMNKRFSAGQLSPEFHKDTGPVITISRQAGCGASKIAHDLCKILNEGSGRPAKGDIWHFINHEILETSAEKLDLDPEKLDRVVTDKERGMMDQIVEALSSHSYKSDQKIMKTVREVIGQFAEQGNVVIVGRGGAVVSQHIARSLHIRLESSFEWRIEQVMKKLEYSRAYATQYIRKIDEAREMYVQRMAQGLINPSLYDVVLDPSRFSESQLIDIILHLVTIKGIR